MMKTYAVYINYKIFDRLYISNSEDTRLDKILEIIKSTPTIIVTQEGGFNKEDKRLNLVFKNPIEGGVCLYTYNFYSDYRINKISDSTNSKLGNKKAIDIEFIINNKILRIVGVHCKEVKKENSNKILIEGIKDLFKPTNNLISYYRSIYDWYYDINDKIEVVLGDFNPKNNLECGEIIRSLFNENLKVFPENCDDIVTTKKIRSGYCAQYKKFWEPNAVCKDLIIVKNADLYNNQIYPDKNRLLTKEWCGDHSFVKTTISI